MPDPISRGKWFLRGLQKTENLLLALAAIVSTAGVCVDVFFRYVLEDPLLGTEEVVRYLQIFMTFIGLAVVVRLKVHINLGVLAELPFFAPKKNLQVLNVVTEAVGIGICAFLGYLSYRYFFLGFTAGSSAAAGIPLVIPYSFLLIGFSLACLHHAQNIIKGIAEIREREK